jgi:hypothetical protein
VDPDAALENLRRLAAAILRQWDAASDEAGGGDFPCCAAAPLVDPHDAYALAEAAEALDGWLAAGGYLPDAWGYRRVAPGRSRVGAAARPTAGAGSPVMGVPS